MTTNNILKIPLNIPNDLLKDTEKKQLGNYSTNNIMVNTKTLYETVLTLQVSDQKVVPNLEYDQKNMQTEYQNIKNYIDTSMFIVNELPKDLSISTISATGKMNCKMLLYQIDKYMKLSFDNIITIKYDGKIRSLIKKSVQTRKKNNNRSFDNQLTMEVIVTGEKKINIKIFKNGSFQMTGCKSIVDCNIVLNKLINRLTQDIATYNKELNKIVDITFVEDVDLENIFVSGFKIDMINSNFKKNYNINRDALFEILKTKGVKCRHEPLIHACVNIKYPIPDDPTDRTVSIFVFQSGNIIITGARNKDQIIKAYNWINLNLEENYNSIIKKDIMNMLDQHDIEEILEELKLINREDTNEVEEDNIIV
jgi:TATA-box binding protein (TBP) (component of TFIID and TFIIIB)